MRLSSYVAVVSLCLDGSGLRYPFVEHFVGLLLTISCGS